MVMARVSKGICITCFAGHHEKNYNAGQYISNCRLCSEI